MEKKLFQEDFEKAKNSSKFKFNFSILKISIQLNQQSIIDIIFQTSSFTNKSRSFIFINRLS
jgi:hypothetical protein